MQAIIEFLDNYLSRTRQEGIGPVEANVILAKAGLLNDSKDRPGKPLRELLRDGKLPHAYQVGGKGSSWIIPHSSKRKSKNFNRKPAATKIERQLKGAEISTTFTSNLESVLMNEKNFKNAGNIDNLVPHTPGLYCIRIIDINKLPEPFNTCLASRQNNIIYIGIATESLNRRFLNQELLANGHGTFFRSLGAVLGYLPPRGSLIAKANKRNYKFSSTDEQKIINWINNNLKVNWVEFRGDFQTLESELIKKHRPLLNLSRNPSALKEVSDLRRVCVQTANEE